MNTSNVSNLMKATAYLIAAAILAPAAILIGASAAVAIGATTAIGVSAIALSDYGKTTCSYREAAAVKRIERHPLAA